MIGKLSFSLLTIKALNLLCMQIADGSVESIFRKKYETHSEYFHNYSNIRFLNKFKTYLLFYTSRFLSVS